jgi:hypothetical protein
MILPATGVLAAVRRRAGVVVTPVLLALVVGMETGCPGGGTGAPHTSSASVHAVRVPHVVDLTGSRPRREASGILGMGGNRSAQPEVEAGRASPPGRGMKSPIAAPFAPRRGPRHGAQAHARQPWTGE